MYMYLIYNKVCIVTITVNSCLSSTTKAPKLVKTSIAIPITLSRLY